MVERESMSVTEKRILWHFAMFLIVSMAFFVWKDYRMQEQFKSNCLATGRSGVECEMMLRLHGRMP
jgi:hypothetical protein